MDRFLEFLRTGIVNGLGVGASAADVRQKFGRPADTSAIKPPIWKDDQTEITFRDGCARTAIITTQLLSRLLAVSRADRDVRPPPPHWRRARRRRLLVPPEQR